MNFPFFVAKRYLISKKSKSVINIISGISVAGVTVGTMALFVVLSVFNGFDGLIKSLFNSFDPDIKILPLEGKNFEVDSAILVSLSKIDGVLCYATVIEEEALLKTDERQYIATIKGVSENYIDVSGVDTMIYEGEFLLQSEQYPFMVVGYGVATFLSTGVSYNTPIKVFAPKRKASVDMQNPENDFNSEQIMISGVFNIQKEFNEKFVFVPESFAAQLLDYENKISYIEVKLNQNLSDSESEKVRENIEQLMGKNFEVKNRYQQNAALYKIMQSEKWIIFLILSFILTIASFNVVGSLAMLIIDKKADIATLRALGANEKSIRKIFLMEGWLISISGAVIGLFLGVTLCFTQKMLGFVPFPEQGFIIQEYPVEMQLFDFLSVFAVVVVIGYIAAWYPVRYITKNYIS